jgi:hypothetical protein
MPILVDLAALGATRNYASFFYKFAKSLYRSIPYRQRILDPPDGSQFEKDAVDGFWDFVDALEMAYGEHGIIMMWDEFLWLDQRIQDGLFDRDAYMVLRDVLQRHDQIDVLIAGTMRLAELSHGSDLSFYGSARVKKISFLDYASGTTLVSRPVEEWLKYDEDAVRMVVQATAGHPLLTQHFANDLCEVARQEGLNKVSVELVRRREHHVLSAASTLFLQLWSQELTPDQQRAFRLLCELEDRVELSQWETRAKELGMNQSRFDRARRGLQEIELVHYERGLVWVSIPLFRRWLIEARPKWN